MASNSSAGQQSKPTQPLSWSSVWVLQSIACASSAGKAPELTGIIACADAINHAVLTYAEFNNAVYYLTEAGLLSHDKTVLSLTAQAQSLLDQFSGLSLLKQAEALRAQLGIDGWTEGYDPNALTAPEVFVSKGRFNSAVQMYAKRY